MAYEVITTGGQSTIKASEGVIELPELAAQPSTVAGFGQLYFKTDKKLYKTDSTGTESEVAAAASGGTVSIISGADDGRGLAPLLTVALVEGIIDP